MKKTLALTLSILMIVSAFGAGIIVTGGDALATAESTVASGSSAIADAPAAYLDSGGNGGQGSGGDGGQGAGGPDGGDTTDDGEAGEGSGGSGGQGGSDGSGAGEGSGSGGSGGGGDGGPPEGSGPPDDHDDDEEEEDVLSPGPINTTGVIEVPGRYYLTEDIDVDGAVATAFEIKSSDVILDGNGYTVSDGTGEAIHVLGTDGSLENVTIRDMTITGWETGLSAMNVKNSTFEDLVIEYNHDAGLVLQSSSGTAYNEILRVTVRENEKGVFLREKVTDTYIYKLTAERNHEVGLKVSGASYTELLSSTFVGHDGEKAIHFTGMSPHNTFVDNVVRDSTGGVESAFQIGGESYDNYFENNTVANNVEVGISIGPKDNVLIENTVTGNGAAGIVVESSGAELRDNVVTDNEVGLHLLGGASGAFDGDVIRDNDDWDVLVEEGVTGNTFTELTLGATVVSIGADSVDFALKGADDPGVSPPGDYETIGKFVEATNTSPDGLLDLRVHYEHPADIDSADESDLIMGRLVGDAWQGVVGTNAVDTGSNYVYATLTEFSVFAPMYGTTDITPPLVEAGEDRTVLAGTEVAFSADASDDTDPSPDVTWDFGDGDTAPGADVTHTYADAGDYTVTVTATDGAGNLATDTIAVTVLGEDTEPPTVDAGEDVTVLSADATVAFDATVTDNLGIESLLWDFGDGDTADVEDPVHTFPSAEADYQVTLTVTDVGGTVVTDVVNVSVIDEDTTRPVAEAGEPITTAIDLETTFDASASTDNIGIVSYTWDFGDGTEPVTTSDPVVTHTYTAEGDFTATLTVEDAAGYADTDTVAVSVGEHLDEETLQPGPIDSFGVIETPGYYYLTQDLNGYGTVGTALEVKVSDVIIDGRGYSIVNGLNESIHILGVGQTESLENITVMNFTISDWETAVFAMNVKNSTFEDLTLASNRDAGLVLAASGATSAEKTADNVIRSSRMEDNEKGLVLRIGVTRTTIDYVEYVENHEAGLKIEGATHTTVTNSRFTGQDGEKAIHITGTAPYNTLIGNTIEDSTGGVENAIHIGGESGHNVLIDNVVRNNAEGGISIGVGPNHLEDNVVYGNGLQGIVLEGNENTLVNNDVHDNNVGVEFLGGSQDNTLTGNAIHSNAEWDVYAHEGASADAEGTDLGDDTVVDFSLTDVALALGGQPDLGSLEDIGKFVEAENTSVTGQLTLEVRYSAEDVAGLDASELRMWRYDAEQAAWELVGPIIWTNDGSGWVADADPDVNGVDTDDRFVYAEITEFSVFAPLIGEFDEPAVSLNITEASLESDDVSHGEPVTVTGTLENAGIEDATVKLELTADGTVVATELVEVTAGAATSFSIDHVLADVGTFDIGVSGYDVGQVTVVDRTPPIADAGGDRTVAVGETVTFDASASSDNVGIVEYDWTLVGSDAQLSDQATFTHEFDVIGEYDLNLTVTDAAGYDDTDTITVTVEEDTTAPFAVLKVSTSSPTAGKTVSFDGSSSSDNVGIASYEWDFGDTNTATGPTVGHAFGQAGDYTVTLTVTDPAGNQGTVSRVLAVAPADTGGDDDGDTGGDSGDDTSDDSDSSSGSSGSSGSGASDGSSSGSTSAPSGAEVTKGVATAPNSDGSFGATVRGAAPGEAVRLGFEWAEMDGRTGIQLRAITVTANQGGDYDLRIRQQVRLHGAVPAFNANIGEPLGYLVVGHSLEESAIERATFEFRVATERLERRALGPEAVALYRYHDGEWQQIRTQLTRQTETEFAFRANSPGLSTFAIVLEDAASYELIEGALSTERADVGDVVTAEATLRNDGSAVSSYTVELLVDGEVMADRTVTVDGGAAKDVRFALKFATGGDYMIAIDDLYLGTVSVLGTAPDEPTEEPVDESVDQPAEEPAEDDAAAGQEVDPEPTPKDLGWTTIVGLLVLLVVAVLAARFVSGGR